MNLLILNAYDADGRAALDRAGATQPEVLYQRLLGRLAPDAAIDVAYPADPTFGLPAGVQLHDYDGIIWTGSSLTIHREGDDRVRRQVDLARVALRAGAANFGSCWGAQLAAVAAGGRCAANPRGREFGVAREIRQTDAGRDHPLFRGKPAVYEAFTSHADEIVALPPDAQCLASNEYSSVQALALDDGEGSFWAVQYHPEYDLHEIASLCRLRAAELVAQGTFPSTEEAEAFSHDLDALHGDPSRTDLAARHRLDRLALDVDQRSVELANWLVEKVKLRTAR